MANEEEEEETIADSIIPEMEKSRKTHPHSGSP